MSVIVSGAALCELIPHAGNMCLLHAVISYDDESITCSTTSHQDRHNPLRHHGRLDALNLIEYAAQAMAVHGGLLAQQQAKQQKQTISQGYLAAVRNVKLAVQTIDDIQSELIIVANRLMASNGNMMYGFEINANQVIIASGRLTVVAINKKQNGAAQ